MVVGGGAGYVLGARAGEQGYRNLTDTAKRAGEQVVVELDRLSGQAADKLQRTRESTRPWASGGGDPSITAAPGTPPEPRSQPVVATPEATTPPAETTSPAKRERPAPPAPPP
jgi:hypothetical protein